MYVAWTISKNNFSFRQILLSSQSRPERVNRNCCAELRTKHSTESYRLLLRSATGLVCGSQRGYEWRTSPANGRVSALDWRVRIRLPPGTVHSQRIAHVMRPILNTIGGQLRAACSTGMQSEAISRVTMLFASTDSPRPRRHEKPWPTAPETSNTKPAPD